MGTGCDIANLKMETKSLKIVFVAFFGVFTLLAQPCIVRAALVTDVRFWSAPDHSRVVLDVTEPVPPMPPCAVAGWFTGKRSSLAFDPSGNPRIAFDAEHWQGLDPVTNPPGSPGCSGFHQDQINARVALFNQP